MPRSTNKNIKEFQEKILAWYSENGRSFIWREPQASNYVRIISEVLLQRTKAETVAKYLPVFLNKYPSWKELGNASQLDLEKILQPLGLYKQRGSRLYKLAQEMKRRNGKFPTNRADVEEMSMMGQYITNAFELFILKKPAPLLDVNMARVLERYFGPRRLVDIRYDPYLQKLAYSIVQHDLIEEINWAVLDFAAIKCKSGKPACENCILKNKCNFHETN